MQRLFRNKYVVLLIIVTVVVLCIMAVSSNGSGKVSFLRNFVGTVISPVQSAFTHVTAGIGGFFGHFTDITKLQEENKELSAKVDNLTNQIRQLEDYKVENERLKGLLDLKDSLDYETITATVVANDASNWFSAFTINKGTKDGIQKYQTVITSKGLVGSVTQVGSNWAKVTSIIDSQSSVGAIIDRTKDMAVVDGAVDLSNEGLCKVSYISKDSKIMTGDIVETSGLGGIFPKGIIIGKVREIKPETKGMSKYAIIEPAVDFSKITEVLVIKQ